MATTHFLKAAALGLLFSLLAGPGWGQSSEYTPRFIEKRKGPINIPRGQKYRFGYLEVPENRQVPDSKTIRLPVYIFKSRSATPAPDPVIYTVGGPGSTTMPSAAYMNYYQYLDDRDVIMFEQRGTAYAQPHLGCPEWAEAIYQSQLPGIGEAEANRLREQAAKACRDRLLAEGIDLNGYHTREIAADIEDLRRLLELDQINLLTISYSTKIAQVLLRDYPEHIRSVVMDSALPLEVSYDEESVANALATTRELLSDCAQDAACGAAYPDLGNRFFTYLEEITRQPLEVQVTHPEEGTLETFSVQGQDIFNMVISAGTEQVPDVPWEIEKLLQGDLSTVKQQLASRLSGPGYADGVGMRLSVWCAEEFPFADSAVMARETRAYPSVTGLSPEVYSASVCAIWGVAPMADLENEPVSSTVPVLFINGQYDEATPSLWAQTMQVRFPNSFHLVFPGWKHTPTTYWSNPCGMAVANAFFNDPTQRPALYCFQELEVSFTQP